MNIKPKVLERILSRLWDCAYTVGRTIGPVNPDVDLEQIKTQAIDNACWTLIRESGLKVQQPPRSGRELCP
jgi:hypothetical protein